MDTPKAPPPQIIALAESLRAGIGSARRKMVPPGIASLDFVSDMMGFAVAYAACDLEVLDAIKAGRHTAAEVASATGLSEDRAYRILRAATQIDLVKEEPGRRFTLLPVGASLCKDADGFRDFLIFMGRVGMTNWARLPDVARDGRTAIELNTGKKPFEFFTGEPEVADSFNRGMTAVSNVAVDAFLAAYPLTGVSTFVDVGGGHGRLIAGALRVAPAMKGILFDLPSVVAGADPILAQYGVKARCEVVGGSFFESVPEGGDLYVMKSIIHDWDDDDARKILATLRRAMKPDARLALYETVVPDPGKKHFAKFLDIEMMVHAGGRERTREEYAALAAREGLRLQRVVPTAGPMSVVELTPA
ncbi:MAG: methyltransferase [Polyangiales bacterium]